MRNQVPARFRSSLLVGHVIPAALLVLGHPPPLHAQTVPPTACAIVTEWTPARPNVVWGNGVHVDSPCPVDSSDIEAAAACDVPDASLDWPWSDVEATALDESVLCCGECPGLWDTVDTIDETARDHAPTPPSETGRGYRP